MLSEEDINVVKLSEVDPPFEGFWRMVINGACIMFGLGVTMIFKSPIGESNPHSFRLQFKCPNTLEKYEALI